jgi:CHAT domain-containing protein/tetratricopeptide (TPR) repeat protein
MDKEQLLQRLRDLPLEEGRAYLREHIAELTDYDTASKWLEDEALRLLYTPFISLKVAELLTSFGEYTQHKSSHALGLKAKGDALMAIGHFRAAMDSLDAARDEFLLLGEEGNAARSRISWIVSAAWTGQVEEALQEAAHARRIFLDLGENYWAGVIDSNTAMIYTYVGRHQDAARLYEGMLAIYATVSDQSESVIKRSIAIAEGNYARNLTVLGDFKHACDLLEKAQANFLLLGEMALVASIEQDLADLDYAQGYYGSALRRYYQAHDTLIQNNIDTPVLLAGIKVSMANCLVKLNRSKEASLLSQEAVEMYRQSGLSFNTGDALREHAAALVASGRLKEALSALDGAQMLFTSGGFEPHAFAVRLQQAQILLETGASIEAYQTALLVREYCDAQGLVARAAHAKLIMAEALLKDAQNSGACDEREQQDLLLESATSLCKQARVQARQHNLQEEIYRSHYLLGRMCLLQGKLSEADRYYRASIMQIERILSDLVYDLSPAFLRTTWRVYEDMIALCLSRERFSQAFNYLEQARSMALRHYLNKASISPDKGEEHGAPALSLLQATGTMIRSAEQELKEWQDRYHYFSPMLAEIDTSASPDVDREVLEAEVKHCETKIIELFERIHLYQSGTASKSPERSKKARSSKEAERVDIAELQRCLVPGQLLLAYFSYQNRLTVFAITSESLITRELPGDIEQLNLLMSQFHAHLDPRGWSSPHNPSQQGVRRLLNKLYNILVEPVAELLPPPSGHVTIVPYGPLHTLPFHALYDGSHFLIERFQVNYYPASTILMHLDRLHRKQTTHPAHTGKPAKPPLILGYSENGHLQRVREEAQTVASLLDGRCYLDQDATIARLAEQASGSPVIHVGTHGQSRPDAPNFSYVRLADGQLNAIDAFSLDLRGCELVTLSGCETGLSWSSGGDEQLGLGRAFLAAGATSLVMSLWSVEDTATNELMQLFYKGLLKGESKVDALRAAQCSLLHRIESAHTHPYYWAAFRLVGDVGRLEYQRAEDQN